MVTISSASARWEVTNKIRTLEKIAPRKMDVETGLHIGDYLVISDESYVIGGLTVVRGVNRRFLEKPMTRALPSPSLGQFGSVGVAH